MRQLRADEAGFALVEVLVSAVLVVIVGLGVLAGFDASGQTSGRSKSRSVAASLAQDDQERLRGLQASELARLRSASRTVRAGGIRYRIVSRVRPMSDTSATGGCTSDSRGFDYFRIISLVDWGDRALEPVRADSLLTPKRGTFGSGEGGLVVWIRNRDAGGQPGIPVSISGPSADSDTTDEDGCAFFPYIPTGNYTISFSRGGYVNPAGETDVQDVRGVVQGSITTAAYDYDRAASVTAAITTRRRGGGGTIPDRGASLGLEHSLLPGGARFFPAGTSSQPSISTGARLFPFRGAHAVFAGSCAGANPAKFNPPAPLPPTQPVQSVQLDPGASVTTSVVEPPINVVVRRALTGRPIGGASVRFRDLTCGTAIDFPAATTNNGRLPEPGAPYGTYDVCASDGTRAVTVRGVQNKDANGTPDVTVVIPATAPAGVCA